MQLRTVSIEFPPCVHFEVVGLYIPTCDLASETGTYTTFSGMDGLMSLLVNDPLTHLAFALHENKGAFALLLGSGLSRSAEIPTGWEITVDLVRRVSLAKGVDEQTDWAAWYRELTGFEPNYSTLLEELTSSPEERRSILHSYIEPSESDLQEGRKTPTAAHRAIARLVRSGYIRVIVTTNFDRLMENALREQGVEPTVVASLDALLGAEPLTHSACYILKLHGDYKDARILNTDSELAAYPAAYDGLLDRIFDEYGMIISGWSGEWDHALRAAFLRAPNRRYATYWASRGSLGNGADQIVAQRRARVVPVVEADSFFTGIESRVETLATSHRQNPQSIDLLVNSTKRYLAKPEFRIQLEELFADEVKNLVERLSSPELTSVHEPLTKDAFRTRVSQYETSSEGIACMLGVLGRWGAGEELVLAMDVIATLYRHGTRIKSGSTVWLNLDTYPAVLAFTAYGLGLVRAKRWDLLHRFADAPLPRDDRETRSIVSSLFLWSWAGGNEKRQWQMLEGLENRKTPLSDHLLDVLREWSPRFAKLEPDFDLLYERFELLCSLIEFEKSNEAALEEAATGTHEIMAWMPVGRIGWHGESLDKLVADLNSPSTRSTLLAAGFAKGKDRIVELFIINLKRYAARIGW